MLLQACKKTGRFYLDLVTMLQRSILEAQKVWHMYVQPAPNPYMMQKSLGFKRYYSLLFLDGYHVTNF